MRQSQIFYSPKSCPDCSPKSPYNGDGNDSTTTTPPPPPPPAGSTGSDPSFQAVLQDFFSPTYSDGVRKSFGTSAFAPGNGIILIRFFIQSSSAAGGTLLGDDRGPSTLPGAPFRIAIAWNTDTGEVTYSVSNSHTSSGWLGKATNMFDHLPCAAKGQQPPIVAGGANDLKIKEAGPEGFLATYSGLNSDIICCSINGTVTVGTEGVFLRGDNYPSAEVIQYKPGAAPLLIGTSMVATSGGSGANSLPGSPFQRAAFIGLPPPIPGSSGIIMAN